MLLDQIGEVLEDLAPGSWVQPRPQAMIKCLTCSRHGGVRIIRLRPSELYKRRAVSRSIHRTSRAAERCATLAANEHAVGNLRIAGELPPIGSRDRVRNHALTQSFRVDQSIELKYVWALTIAGRASGASTFRSTRGPPPAADRGADDDCDGRGC